MSEDKLIDEFLIYLSKQNGYVNLDTYLSWEIEPRYDHLTESIIETISEYGLAKQSDANHSGARFEFFRNNKTIEIVNNGGWIKYKKEKERIDIRDERKKENDAWFSGIRRKTYIPLLTLTAFSTIYSIYRKADDIYQSKQKETKEYLTPTKQEQKASESLESKTSIIHPSNILNDSTQPK